jgi:hypothetical protein
MSHKINKKVEECIDEGRNIMQKEEIAQEEEIA